MNQIESLQHFETYLETNVSSMTENELSKLQRQLNAFQKQIDEAIQAIRFRPMAFVRFFRPEIASVSFAYTYNHGDDGGYSPYFDTATLEGCSYRPLDVIVQVWGKEFTYSNEHIEIMDFQSIQSFVDTLQHPLLNLFGGYTPPDGEEWSKLWALMRSTNLRDFNQGCVLLEGLIEGDGALRTALINTYSSHDIDELLGFHCNRWWMVLFVDDTIYNRSEGMIGDLYLDGYDLEYDFNLQETPADIIMAPIMIRVYQWISQAMKLNNASERELQKIEELVEPFKQSIIDVMDEYEED